MKLIYIAKLNTFVYATGEYVLSNDEKKYILTQIQDGISGITPKPHFIILNGEFDYIDDFHSHGIINTIKRLITHATKTL